LPAFPFFAPLLCFRSGMSKKFVLNATVSYGDVDRDEHLLLSGIFKFLQEAAIRHANAFGTGTRAAAVRGEAWVLNRLAAGVEFYPRHEDNLRIETWSRGISGFRGYREYRVYAGEQLAISASSLWIYVNVAARSPLRVPLEIAEQFPSHPGDAYQADIDKGKLEPPDRARSQPVPVSLRYADFDGLGHVNNTAYFEFLQTALARKGLPCRPRHVQIRFVKEIPPGDEAVDVLLDQQDRSIRFGIVRGDVLSAHGTLA
jgi:medium-chain acyl-[acyl-carrier-protein] hydrolase